MKEECRKILDETSERFPDLKMIEKEIEQAFKILKGSFEKSGRLYLCGNGGSASDCEHIAGELLKSFKMQRPIKKAYQADLSDYGEEGNVLAENLECGLPAISLCGHPAFSTAFSNDINPYFVFAQQVNVFGCEGDALLAISTSGNSKNCVYAAIAAKAKKMKVIFLGGGNGGKLKELADVSIIVPEHETYKVQELHLPVYHCLCAMLERYFFGDESKDEN